MRQAGIIAAAGITALEHMVDRLAEDHRNAHRLAEGISQIEGLLIDPSKVQTNIVYFDLVAGQLTAEQFIARLTEKGIKALCVAKPAHFRMVTHHGIDSHDIDMTLAAMSEVMAES